MSKESLAVGGQALIEGVMMRNGEKIGIAIRKKGKIIVKTEKFIPISKRYKILGLPFIRGFISMFEMMFVGTRALIYSANEASEEDEDESLSSGHIAFAVFTAVLFSIGLFVLLPYFLTYLSGLREESTPIIFNFVDGLIKLSILVLYVYLIGRMKDVKRVFQYHGAEHKAVHAYEHSRKMVPKECDCFSTIHTRCGTSFLMFVILVGVVIFSFIPIIVQNIFPNFLNFHPALRYSVLFTSRLIVLPVIAGISYEWLKFTPKLSKKSFLSIISLPGMWVQKLTTNEPTEDQLEVAIAALKAVTENKPKKKDIKSSKTKKKINKTNSKSGKKTKKSATKKRQK